MILALIPEILPKVECHIWARTIEVPIVSILQNNVHTGPNAVTALLEYLVVHTKASKLLRPLVGFTPRYAAAYTCASIIIIYCH